MISPCESWRGIERERSERERDRERKERERKREKERNRVSSHIYPPPGDVRPRTSKIRVGNILLEIRRLAYW